MKKPDSYHSIGHPSEPSTFVFTETTTRTGYKRVIRSYVAWDSTWPLWKRRATSRPPCWEPFMTIHGPILAEFGAAQVLFPSPRRGIPPALRTEFELLMFADRPPAELESWIRRLETELGVTGVHRRAALCADRKSKGLKARGDPEQIDELLRAGFSIKDAAQRLGLQRSYVAWRAKQLRADDRENSMDASVPKFADDTRHIADVRSAGGFAVLAIGIQRPPGRAYHARDFRLQP